MKLCKSSGLDTTAQQSYAFSGKIQTLKIAPFTQELKTWKLVYGNFFQNAVTPREIEIFPMKLTANGYKYPKFSIKESRANTISLKFLTNSWDIQT